MKSTWPGGVDQVQDDDSAWPPNLPRQPHVLRLDRDAAFPLDVHPVEVLGAHRPLVDDAGELQHPVGQRGLAVVDVGDDAEVPNLRRRGEGLVGETADGNLLVKPGLGASRVSRDGRCSTIAGTGRPKRNPRSDPPGVRFGAELLLDAEETSQVGQAGAEEVGGGSRGGAGGQRLADIARRSEQVGVGIGRSRHLGSAASTPRRCGVVELGQRAVEHVVSTWVRGCIAIGLSPYSSVVEGRRRPRDWCERPTGMVSNGWVAVGWMMSLPTPARVASPTKMPFSNDSHR